jgi:hypothetical protein
MEILSGILPFCDSLWFNLHGVVGSASSWCDPTAPELCQPMHAHPNDSQKAIGWENLIRQRLEHAWSLVQSAACHGIRDHTVSLRIARFRSDGFGHTRIDGVSTALRCVHSI